MSTADIELDALAVFSHPDDAELTVAGTLLKLKSLGYRTGVLDMTRGEMGTRGTPEGRAEEARRAAEILKLDVRLNLEQPDGHVWLNEDSRRVMVRVIRAHKPKLIFTSTFKVSSGCSPKKTFSAQSRWRRILRVKRRAPPRLSPSSVPCSMQSRAGFR